MRYVALGALGQQGAEPSVGFVLQPTGTRLPKALILPTEASIVFRSSDSDWRREGFRRRHQPECRDSRPLGDEDAELMSWPDDLLCLPVLLALLTSSGIALGEEVDDGIAVGVGSTGTTGTRSRWGPPLRSTPTAAPQATVRAMGRSCAYRTAPRSNERRLGCRRQEQGTSLGTSHITGYVALTKETCLAG